jgi:lysyl-tRNA synthetase class 1
MELASVPERRIQPGEAPPRVPSFRPLSMILQIYDGDLDEALAYYERIGEISTPAERDRFRVRAPRVWRWIEAYAPEEFCYRIRQEPRTGHLEGEPREILARLVAVLEDHPAIGEAELIPHLKVLCEGTSLTAKEFYPYAYDLLIGRDKGPKLTTLLTAMGSERSLPLLRAGLG